MNGATYAVRNALRSKRRTVLTIFSLAVSIFAIATLATFIEAFGYGLEETEALGRLIAKRRTSLIDLIPQGLKERIESIDGVQFAHGTVWFGGKVDRADIPPEKAFFANFADDVPTFRAASLPWVARMDPPNAIDLWYEEKTSAFVGEELMRRFGWTIGDKVTLFGTIYPVNADVVIVGVYKAKPGFDDKVLFFRRDYLEEMLKRTDPTRAGRVGVYVVKPEPGKGPDVSRAIDAMTVNSDAETETVTEKEFNASFAEMLGNLKQFIFWIGGAVALTTLLVAGNTMAMSARERSNEGAVMQTLGFPRWYIASLFVAEGLAVTVAGGALGAAGATMLYLNVDWAGGGWFVQPLRVSTQTLVLCASLTLGVGLLASGIPAIATARRSIALGLRKVV